MPRRRRGGWTGPPKCPDGCGAVVVWFGSATGPGRRCFEPQVYRGQQIPTGVVAQPVYGGRAWRLADLVEHLQVQRGCGATEAEDEARDMPWHRLHHCDTHTTDTREGAPADDTAR